MVPPCSRVCVCVCLCLCVRVCVYPSLHSINPKPKPLRAQRSTNGGMASVLPMVLCVTILLFIQGRHCVAIYTMRHDLAIYTRTFILCVTILLFIQGRCAEQNCLCERINVCNNTYYVAYTYCNNTYCVCNNTYYYLCCAQIISGYGCCSARRRCINSKGAVQW